MGYSQNERAISRVEQYLQEIASLPPDTQYIEWEAEDVMRFAYYIRQAFDLAKKNKDVNFGRLKDQFVIRQRKDTVRVERRSNSIGKVKPKGLHTVVFPQIIDMKDVVMSLIDNTHLQGLEFPNVVLSDEQVNELTKFVTSRERVIASLSPLKIVKQNADK